MHIKDPVVHVKSLVDYGHIKITQHALKRVRGLKLDVIRKRKKKKKKKEQCFRKQPSIEEEEEEEDGTMFQKTTLQKSG